MKYSLCRPLLNHLSFALAVLAIAGVLCLPARADDLEATPGGQQKTSAELPLREVVLFSSGVGYFGHQGKVEGDARVEMQFRAEEINDLLKSMVVQDLDGGRVSTVSYASKDPITKTLKTFAIDLTTKPTLAQLLGQVRGQRVELETSEIITGVIVGIERQKQPVGDKAVVDVDVLNVLTDKGLRAVSLKEVSRIRLLNRRLDAELRKALLLLATAHDSSKKSVTLDLLGEGTRRVTVGYIRQTPVWKTSYRLVLDDEKAPLLQGWAIVENTSEQDWENVRLRLISGRPISFIMDLYDPLYIPRPVVQLDLFASLRPQVYGQDMAGAELDFLAKDLKRMSVRRSRGVAKKTAKGVYAREVPLAATSPAAGGMGGMGRMGMGTAGYYGRGVIANRLGESVQSAAIAGEVGELFQYDIETPVTLTRQKSAMLPIVNAKVKGKKVSIYNASVHAKHPLSGLRLTNATDLHLMQGPITVFDGGVYAGDARIEDLPPGTERLISYAMDLDTEVSSRPKDSSSAMTSIRLYKGTMIVTRKSARSREYTVKNSGSKPKTVLVEQPIDHGWKLMAPKKPTEKTRDRYRFAVEALPGEPAKLVVSERRIHDQHVSLSNVNSDDVQVYLRSKVISRKVKDALAEVIERKQALSEVIRQRKDREAQIAEIDKEQRRIRDNMGRLNRNSELYKRYVKKFSNQEDTIERLREEIHGLKEKENELRTSLDRYLKGLQVE